MKYRQFQRRRKPHNQRTFEVTFIETNRTRHYTLREAHARFGREEFMEILKGYLPHIVAIEL